MKKSEFIDYWSKIEPNQELRPVPIPYKHKGTTFDCDGIRILGSREFIEQVLSRLSDLLTYESGGTRLGVSYSQSTDKDTGEPLDAYKCYIQVHERGRQAQIVNAIFK